MEILSLHNSNGEFQSHLGTHGLKDIPEYFQIHYELFMKHKSSSEQSGYIQAYKHTVELLITHFYTEALLDKTVIGFLTLCHPSHLFSLCIHVLKKPEKPIQTYQNSLTILLYTLQPVKLADIITSNVHICATNSVPGEITILNPIQSHFIQTLCAVPDLVMNKLSRSLLMVESNTDYTKSPIHPDNYFSHITKVVFTVMTDLTESSGRSILYFASLFHQICLLGYSTVVAQWIIHFVERKNYKKPTKIEFLKMIISKMLPRGLEKLLEALLSQYYTLKFAEKSFFSSILVDPQSSTRMKTVLIDRLIMSRHFTAKQSLLLHNLIHYISNESGELVGEVLENILTAFNSEMYMDKISIDQHMYLCRVIILCVRYYTIRIQPHNAMEFLHTINEASPNQDEENEPKQEPLLQFPSNFPKYPLLLLTQNAIGNLLKNTRNDIKLAGQLCGEVLSFWFNQDATNKLSFDFPTDNPIVKDLRALLTSKHDKPPVVKREKCTMDAESNSELLTTDLIPDLENMFGSETNNEIILPNTNTGAEPQSSDEIQTLILPGDLKTEKKRPLIEILSDSENSDSEDLQPFPNPNIDNPAKEETPKSHTYGSRPILGPYSLRECVEWMGTNTKSSNEAEDMKRLEAALRRVESFIRASPHDIKIWSHDLAEILLNLTNKGFIENCETIRLNALVALCVVDPISTAKYLTTEFYAENMVICSRFDVLVCLERAGAELANIIESKTDVTQFSFPLAKNERVIKNTKVWEDVIKERLKLKTRIISSARKEVRISENIFGGIVGHFFYPLLYNFDKSIQTMDFFGKDVWLFCALLKTLGSLIIYAQGTIALRKMSSTLFDFLTAIKSVDNPLVKQGISFCVLCVLEVTPAYYLLPELSNQLNELSEFMRDTSMKVADENTALLTNRALQQITLFYKQFV